MNFLKFFDSPVWVFFECFFGPYLLFYGDKLPPSVFAWWSIGILMVIHALLTVLGWFLKSPLFQPKTKELTKKEET